METEIDVDVARTDEDAAAGVAVAKLGGAGPGGEIEPTVDCPFGVGEVAVFEAIGTVSASAGGVRYARRRSGREFFSRRHRPDAGDVPVPDDVAPGAARNELASFPKREFPVVVDDGDVVTVFGHGAPFASGAAAILRGTVAASVDVRSVGHVF